MLQCRQSEKTIYGSGVNNWHLETHFKHVKRVNFGSLFELIGNKLIYKQINVDVIFFI